MALGKNQLSALHKFSTLGRMYEKPGVILSLVKRGYVVFDSKPFEYVITPAGAEAAGVSYHDAMCTFYEKRLNNAMTLEAFIGRYADAQDRGRRERLIEIALEAGALQSWHEMKLASATRA